MVRASTLREDERVVLPCAVATAPRALAGCSSTTAAAAGAASALSVQITSITAAKMKKGAMARASSTLRPVARLGNRLAHGGVGLHVLHAVVVHDAEVSAAECLGHGFGNFRFRQHDLRA